MPQRRCITDLDNPTMNFTKPPLGISATARELKLSESRVRQLAANGVLPAVRTDRGLYLFDPGDVARFRDERAARLRQSTV
jgi:hypothetical protein